VKRARFGASLAAATLLAACGGETAPALGAADRALAPAETAPSGATGAAHELELARARIRELEARVANLESARVAREREWLDYTQDIARLGSLAEFERVRFTPAVDPAAAPATTAVAPPPRPRDPAQERAFQRDTEIARSLRALLVVEQVAGLELLEAGHLSGGAIGPVVFRTLDDRGVPLGALCAARLRLEASRSARTLVLVLEDGYERRGDARTPFEPDRPVETTRSRALELIAAARAADASAPVPAHVPPTEPASTAAISTEAARADEPSTDVPEGAPADAAAAPVTRTRRIVFTHVDPGPWIDALPELFRDVDMHAAPDDGRWDLTGVRFTLNEFLRADAAAGYWRLAALGGVTEGELRDVQLDELDAAGRIVRKFFADRLTIVPQTNGVRLELADGAQLRGDVKTPFQGGQHSIFLPRADLEAWRAAGLPGLSEPPRRARR
jgi:hypothetical protein